MSKSKRKEVISDRSDFNPSNIINFDKCTVRKSVRIIPRNIHQEEYLDYLYDERKIVVTATGPAGVGKTQMAMMAGIKALNEKKVNKLILTRPIVAVEGEDKLGALPGDLNEKMDPYTRPLYDVLTQYYSGRDIVTMLENRIIEICPLSFMRGRNFSNTFIIFDEAQNSTIAQCKVILTRLCEGTKLIITGDNSQSDRRDSDNGLLFFTNATRLLDSEYIASINFGVKDVQRHPVVSEVLDIFDKAGY